MPPELVDDGRWSHIRPNVTLTTVVNTRPQLTITTLTSVDKPGENNGPVNNPTYKYLGFRTSQSELKKPVG